MRNIVDPGETKVVDKMSFGENPSFDESVIDEMPFHRMSPKALLLKQSERQKLNFKTNFVLKGICIFKILV